MRGRCKVSIENDNLLLQTQEAKRRELNLTGNLQASKNPKLQYENRGANKLTRMVDSLATSMVIPRAAPAPAPPLPTPPNPEENINDIKDAFKYCVDSAQSGWTAPPGQAELFTDAALFYTRAYKSIEIFNTDEIIKNLSPTHYRALHAAMELYWEHKKTKRLVVKNSITHTPLARTTLNEIARRAGFPNPQYRERKRMERALGNLRTITFTLLSKKNEQINFNALNELHLARGAIVFAVHELITGDNTRFFKLPVGFTSNLAKICHAQSKPFLKPVMVIIELLLQDLHEHSYHHRRTPTGRFYRQGPAGPRIVLPYDVKELLRRAGEDYKASRMDTALRLVKQVAEVGKVLNIVLSLNTIPTGKPTGNIEFHLTPNATDFLQRSITGPHLPARQLLTMDASGRH